MMSSTGSPRHRRPERRQLTVVFCDLVGSTALSNRIDAEELTEIIVAYRETVKRCVDHYDGMVARYVGDGVLAYFGYPYAHEDAAERAIRAALSAVAAVRQLTTRDGQALRTHVGIATGSVVVGKLPDGGPGGDINNLAHDPEEISAIGPAPNLAAHLQTSARPDTVVVSAATRRLAGRLFRYQFLGHAQVKGFEEKVPTWKVIGERTLLSRFHALHTVGRAPIVGRSRELAKLAELWERARGGRGQAVLLSGDPGFGKSRLAEAAVRSTLKDAATQIWYYCAPHSQSSALAPLVRQLTLAAAIDPGDPDPVKLEKLTAILPAATRDGGDAVPLLADLLSIDYACAYPELKMSPQRRRRRLFETLLSVLSELARRSPVVIVAEDLHWIDPSSLELIETAIEHVSSLPVMLVLSARPAFHAPWAGKANVHDIVLAPLERDDSLALVRNLAGAGAISGPLMDRITDRADGVPLFLEDLTRDVMESAGTKVDPATRLEAASVPASLQDSLMSRLDRIGETGKRIAQVAAVFGREFSRAMLVGTAEIPDTELDAALDQLASSGLVARVPGRAPAAYVFRHVLIRDTAYSSLLRKERARLHGLAARLLFDEFPELTAQQPELLAHHYERAGDVETAANFWLAAGRRSAKRSSFREAIDQLQHVLSLLAGQPRTRAITQLEMAVYIALGGAQAGYRGFSASESGEAYARALVLARDLDSVNEFFLALSGAGSYHITRAEFDTCHALAEECLSRSARLNLAPPAVIGRRLLGGTLFLTGNLESAVENLEEAVAVYEKHASSFRETELMYVQDHKSTALCYLALAYTVMGYLDRGLRCALASLGHSRAIGDLHTTNFSLTYLAAVHHFRRDSPQAMERARESMEMALEQEFATWVGVSRMIYGEALVQAEGFEEGLAAIMSGTREHGTMQAITYQPFGISLLVKALLRIARVDDAAAALERAEAVLARSGENWYQPELWRLKSMVLLAREDRAGAEDLLRQAVALARAQRARFWELRAATALARLLADNGDGLQARRTLQPVYDWFPEGHDTPHLQAARSLLSELPDQEPSRSRS